MWQVHAGDKGFNGLRVFLGTYIILEVVKVVIKLKFKSREQRPVKECITCWYEGNELIILKQSKIK